MAEALAHNPSLVEYQKALRWNGQLPQNVYAGTPIPFFQPDRATASDANR